MAVDYTGFAFPKGAARVEVKAAKDKSDEKAALLFRKAVWTRDGGVCRRCGRKVVKSIELLPNRGAVHHIAKRSKVPELLTDARNGILVCELPCHLALERHQVAIVGTPRQHFALNGSQYLDASKRLRFIDASVNGSKAGPLGDATPEPRAS